MTTTPNLGITYLDSGVPQPEVIHNDALRVLDAVVQLVVLDRDLATPPSTPAAGDRYIVGASPTGAWTGHAKHVVAWQDGGWHAYVPETGWLAFVVDEGMLLVWSGSAWLDAMSMPTSLQNLSLLGLATTADSTNPFSAKLNNALWVAKTVAEGGDGNLRYKMSKESAAKTLSLLLQTNFSGRAELGFTGDDDLHLKVSPDGSTWVEALTVDRSTGGVRFLASEASVASAATCDIGAAAALKVQITGTTTVTSFGSVANAVKLVRFAGALTLTHNGTSLILPAGANLATAAGDCAIATSDASGNWRVRVYQRANGKAVAAPAADDYGIAQIAGGTMTAGGRLTLQSATPVMSTSQAGKTTIYYALHVHDKVPITDGSNWHWTTFSELSNDTTASSTGKAGPAAVAASKTYDLFVWNDAGTLRLTRGPAWSSDTARGTGGGTTELQQVNGVGTNKVAITNGPGANLGSFVGTVRSNGSSQIDWIYGSNATSGQGASLGVWNMYNRVNVGTTQSNGTSTWTYSSATLRPSNNSTANRISFISGLAEEPVSVSLTQQVNTPAVDGATALTGFALDATNVQDTAGLHYSNGPVANATAGAAAKVYAAQLGWHFVQQTEAADGTNTSTFVGSSGRYSFSAVLRM